MFAELVEDGLEGLAVSAPRSVELNQDVLLGVQGNISEVLANQNLETQI